MRQDAYTLPVNFLPATILVRCLPCSDEQLGIHATVRASCGNPYTHLVVCRAKDILAVPCAIHES